MIQSVRFAHGRKSVHSYDAHNKRLVLSKESKVARVRRRMNGASGSEHMGHPTIRMNVYNSFHPHYCYSQVGTHQISVPEGDHVGGVQIVVGENVEHALAHSLSLAAVFAQVVHRDSVGSLRGHVLYYFERGVGATVVDKGKHDTGIFVLRTAVRVVAFSVNKCSAAPIVIHV